MPPPPLLQDGNVSSAATSRLDPLVARHMTQPRIRVTRL